MERARALPVRGQGFSHLEQQLQRTGYDQPLSGRASGPRRRRRLRCPIVISSCRPIRDELFQADADGWLHMFFATRWHDPVTQQLHDLIESRSR
jgi:hypothetical protein